MQSVSPNERKRRAIVLRLMFEMRNIRLQRADPLDMTWIILAIHMGQYDGRPLCVSNIANITHIPRTTVIRHLKALKSQGRATIIRVGQRTIPVIQSDTETQILFDVLTASVRRAAALLSAMDT